MFAKPSTASIAEAPPSPPSGNKVGEVGAFSVLMSVYDGEHPMFLRAALRSVHEQSLRPAEVVVVQDGPLRKELRDAIGEWLPLLPIKVLQIEQNVGLGRALAAGLLACSHDLVARCDSDDVNLPTRFRSQFEFLGAHPTIDVVGTAIEEFQVEPGQTQAIRRTPQAHADILKMLRWRNPFNHMTVMFRRQRVLEAGNYESCAFFEDYWLWVRLAHLGAGFSNLPEALVLARVGNGMLQRRRGLPYLRAEIAFQRKCRRAGFIGSGEFIARVVVRNSARLMPSKWFKYFYLRFLRRT